MLDPATARLCVWRLPLEAAFRLFSKLGSLGGSIRERFSRTGRTRPALARPAFSRWLLENDRLRERWPCQWLNVLYFPFSETSPGGGWSATALASNKRHRRTEGPRVDSKRKAGSADRQAIHQRQQERRQGVESTGPHPTPSPTTKTRSKAVFAAFPVFSPPRGRHDPAGA